MTNKSNTVEWVRLHFRAVIEAINQGKGWEKLGKLSEDDVNKVQEIIFTSFCSVLRRNDQDTSEFLCFDDIGDYHMSRASTHHQDMWPKKSRIFGAADTAKLTNLLSPFLSTLFSSYLISDEERLGHANIYWRLVRPESPEDLGPAHRDCWFWELDPSLRMPPLKSLRYKIWLPLISEPGINTLGCIDFSQLDESLEWSSEIRNGVLKPTPTDCTIETRISIPRIENGELVIFHDRLVHKGTLNSTRKTRVSLEFTVCVNEDDLK